MIFALALGPLLWIALAIWCLVRQAAGSKLSINYFTATLVTQFVVIALPFAIYNWSVGAAGLSDFAVCPNGQEYCDEFYQLERLGDRMLFQLSAAFWIGVLIWFLTMFRRTDIRVERRTR